MSDNSYPTGGPPPAYYPPASYPPAEQPPANYPPANYPVATYPLGYAAPRPTSGLAVASLICGIAGTVLGMFLVPLLASIVAIITGHMALSRLRQRPDIAGRGLAITGLVLGYLGIAFLAVIAVIAVLSIAFIGSFSLLPVLVA